MELRTHVGEDLSYVVVEPDGFDPEREYPVVYLLHGYLSNMRDLPGLSPSISRDGCLYVSPQRASQDRHGSECPRLRLVVRIQGPGDRLRPAVYTSGADQLPVSSRGWQVIDRWVLSGRDADLRVRAA